MSTKNLHPVSMVLGAVIAVAASALMGMAQAKLTAQRIAPGPMQIAGIPTPQQMMRVLGDGAPFTVPAGQLFVVTGLTNRTNVGNGQIFFDGSQVLYVQDVASRWPLVPAGLVAGEGVTVSAATNNVILGYLVDE